MISEAGIIFPMWSNVNIFINQFIIGKQIISMFLESNDNAFQAFRDFRFDTEAHTEK